MKTVLPIIIALLATAGAQARAESTGQVHPAVVRVIVPDINGTSLGSGALVATAGSYGLVVTNWHVICDTRGHIEVVFPDGFRSSATLVKFDRDWDLAALIIWRPRVRPIPLASARPQIGEPLAIAGYGRGNYRIAAGQCTAYVAPLGSFPSEMIEVSAGARKGDSGGPILNRQGELAGVLFGSAWGKTTGSHCLRVREFLQPVLNDFNALPNTVPGNNGTMLANQTSPGNQTPNQAAAPRPPAPPSRPATASIAARPPAPRRSIAPPARTGPTVAQGGWVAAAPTTPSKATPSQAAARPTVRAQDADVDILAQLKTFLAAVGLFALLFHGIRLLGAK
ncbi:MAG: trypsin-like peptidase domain-containing protein [Pirellulales bacterium]|nr:trypsin-like peptidase domain-containing protein [Pirellulales bacterium]